MIKLYLDDERNAPFGWIRTYSVDETIEKLSKEFVDELSLDNDLGENKLEGYKVLEWLEEQVFNNKDYRIPKCFFHTENPVARKRMEQIYSNILKMKKK